MLRWRCRVEQFEQRAAQTVAQHLIAALHALTEERLRGVEFTPHLEILRALAGKEEGDFRRSLSFRGITLDALGRDFALGKGHKLGLRLRDGCRDQGQAVAEVGATAVARGGNGGQVGISEGR